MNIFVACLGGLIASQVVLLPGAKVSLLNLRSSLATSKTTDSEISSSPPQASNRVASLSNRSESSRELMTHLLVGYFGVVGDKLLTAGAAHEYIV